MRKWLIYLLMILMWPGVATACGSESGDSPVVPAEPSEKDHFSGVWVTSVASDALNSRDNIVSTVDMCVRSGINNIFVVVWNKGLTLYPSKVMKDLIGKEIDDTYAGRDPLKEMIEEGHRRGVKVHAWFEYGFAASNNAGGGAIIAARPHWAAKDIDGRLLTKNGFEWMNAFYPEVQDFMMSLVMEVVESYDVDGVQGDDRMPALPSTGGYDDYTRQLYRSENGGIDPPSDYKDTQWVNWRADKLTDFQKRLYARVKSVKPDVTVSCAPSIHPWAKNEYLQDWPAWFENGCVDLVIPQHYRYDIDAYEQVLTQQLSYLQPKDRNKFYPGVLIRNGNYSPSEEFLRKMIEANRRHGITGESFWFFEGLKELPGYFGSDATRL